MQKFLPIKKSIYSLSCHDAVLDSCHSTCRRAQGSTNISHTHFICGKQLYTAKSYAKYFSETVQEFRAERDRKVTHQSGTFPEKYKQSYNCQRQKTLPASAYAAMGLRHLQDRRYYPISKPQRMKRTIRKLAPYIQASGAKMVLYQTWARGNGIMIITGTIPCQTALITRVFLTVRSRRSPKSTMLSSLRLAQHFCSAAILRMGSNF